MCGIVGYVGHKVAKKVIFDGLKTLEYRGYDSAGIALIDDERHTQMVKQAGKLDNLVDEMQKLGDGVVGIGHTRWATHGEPNQINAHPHRYGPVTIVHNGIIENHNNLRSDVKMNQFESDTDSELFAHMIAKEREADAKSLLDAVRTSFAKLAGNSAFVVMDERIPDTIVAVRTGSPLVVGIGEKEMMVASDVPAILAHTRDVYYMQEGEVAVLTTDSFKLFDLQGKEKKVQMDHIEWDADSISKHGYDHFMLKEIHEQSQAIADTLRPWLRSDSLELKADGMDNQAIVDLLVNARSISLVACGTASYACNYGASLLEKFARVSCKAELASEFRYRDPLLTKDDVGIVVSQSGETADTMAAVHLMKKKGMKVLLICNVRGSSLARLCDAAFYTNAGIEISVASTKAFTTQLSVFLALSVFIGQAKGLIQGAELSTWLDELQKLPDNVETLIADSDKYKSLAKKHADKKGYLFLGRGVYYPIALEGALKLKELAYVHAEGYPAGELKHGPIAMVDPEMLIIAIAPEGEGTVHSKTVSNVEEVRARKGVMLGLGSAKDAEFKKICADYLEIPKCSFSELYPILSTIPLQLFAYFVALEKGTDIDQPRNLAKSVTVE